MKSLLALILLLLSHHAFSAVWTSTNKWDHRHEANYTAWVTEHFKSDIFTSGKYNGIATDCADAAYTMRLIFSYENHLPFVTNNGLSNSMTNWDHYSNELNKVRAFINHVNNKTSTKSLPNDTYPAPMTKRGLAAGGIYVAPGTHAYQIIGQDNAADEGDFGILKINSSTVPKKIRELWVEKTFPQYMPGQEISGYRDGYRRFRWPEHLGLKQLRVPGASDQQYKMAKKHGYQYMPFTDELARILGKNPEPIHEKVERMVFNLCDLSVQRRDVVDAAIARSKALNHQPMGPTDYNNHSTPGRDARLKKSFEHLRTLIKHPRWRQDRNHYYSAQHIEFMFSNKNPIPNHLKEGFYALCYFSYDYWGGTPSEISMFDIWRRLDAGLMSSNPNDNIHKRWGFGGR